MKKLSSIFFFAGFFLTGCSTMSLQRQYTEFYTIDGVGYVCEFIHGEKMSCNKKMEKENEKKEIVAFLPQK